MATCKLRDTCTVMVEYDKVGDPAGSYSRIDCPHCLKPMVRRWSEKFTHTWIVDSPGVQIECRRCGFEWIVEAVRVTLRRIK